MIALLPPPRTLGRLGRLRLDWGPGARGVEGSRRVARPGTGRDLHGARPWEAGDDLRDLDWATTMRFGQPWLRVYRPHVEGSLLLALDTSASMGFGAPGKLAYAQALAAALGYLALDHHDAVGMVAFGADTPARLRVGRGARQWRALLDRLGGLHAEGAARFDAVPAALADLDGLRGVAVILSDLYVPDAFARGLRHLARSTLRVVVVHVLSPQELAPDVDGAVELRDAETGQARTGWIGAAERRAYLAALDELQRQARARCHEAGARYVRVSTDVTIAHCLERTLVGAGVLRRDGA